MVALTQPLAAFMSPTDRLDQPPRRGAVLPIGDHARADGATPFWSAGIGVGVAVILTQLADTDALSQQFQAMPARRAGSRALLTNYLDTVDALAQSWLQRSRPTLMLAIRALVVFPDTLSRFGIAHGDGEHSQLADAMIQQLGNAQVQLEQLGAEVGHCLEQMALAAGELETDTVLVAYRLQADALHAAMLAQHESTLSRHGNAAALASTRRQLKHLHATRQDTLAEATCLQALLPTLSAYLASVDRMSAGIDSTMLGIHTVQAGLNELAAALRAGAFPEPQTVQAALPHWRCVAARIAASGS